MATILENLRNLNAKHRQRVETATEIAERIKKVAEAARSATQTKEK